MLVCGADGQRIASLVSWLGCSVVPGVRKSAMFHRAKDELNWSRRSPSQVLNTSRRLHHA